MVLIGLVERAILAGVAATDAEHWSEAAELWFDLAVRPATTALAAPLAAEAALRTGDLDLADQMRARLDEAGGCPDWLTALFGETLPLRAARKARFSSPQAGLDPGAFLALDLPREAIRAVASGDGLDQSESRRWLIRAHHMLGEHDRVLALADVNAEETEAALIAHSRLCQERRGEGVERLLRRFGSAHPAADAIIAATQD